jgi:hypothetical protein
MQEEVKNYLSLVRFPLRHKYFVFLDAGDYLQEYGREGSP